MFSHWINTDFIASLFGIKVIPVATSTTIPEPGTASILHVKCPPHNKVSFWSSILLQPTHIRRRNWQLLFFTSLKIVPICCRVTIRTATKQACSTSTTIKVNSLKLILSLNTRNVSTMKLTDAGVLLSGQQPNSLSLQVHPSCPGPLAMLTPSGQHPYSYV